MDNKSLLYVKKVMIWAQVGLSLLWIVFSSIMFWVVHVYLTTTAYVIDIVWTVLIFIGYSIFYIARFLKPVHKNMSIDDQMVVNVVDKMSTTNLNVALFYLLFIVEIVRGVSGYSQVVSSVTILDWDIRDADRAAIIKIIWDFWIYFGNNYYHCLRSQFSAFHCDLETIYDSMLHKML
eukprot:234209_1